MKGFQIEMTDTINKPTTPQNKTTHRIPTDDAYCEFKKEDIEQSIVDRFEQQVRAVPHRIALKSKQNALTYEELNQFANRLAWTIRDQSNPGEPIGLLLEHDTPILVAIMGVLKAGGIYVPLEPAYPKERLVYMLSDSKARLIITNSKNINIAKSLSHRILNLDGIPSEVSPENPELHISPDSPAYILYTSGSTGQPKGIFNSHRNLLHQVMSYTNSVNLIQGDRHSLLQSCSFSRTLKEIFGSLLNGATLCMYDIKEDGLAHLADWLIKEKITLLGSAVTVYRLFMGSLTGNENFSDLRLIYLGAEPFYKKDVELYKKHFPPKCIMIHGMGATETGTFLRFLINKETRLKGNSIPAGYALQDMEVRLVDEAGKDTSTQEGEIVVKSRYLSLGYWGQPELTQAMFHADPQSVTERIYYTGDLGRLLDNGSIVHLGRKDFQLKIRGHRVEIAEIEGALYNIGGIEQAVIVIRGGESGSQRLIACMVPGLKGPPGIDYIRQHLAETLPEYMIPDEFIFLDAMPYTPNGKVDRRALMAMEGTGRTSPAKPIAPKSPIEKELATMWMEVLKIDQVGVHDNFFDLGGNSLAATRIIARIYSEFNVKLVLLKHFLKKEPTISNLAYAIIEKLRAHATVDMTALLDEVEQTPEEENRSLSNNLPYEEHGIHKNKN
jgi:amino acid adenylation domain-containing protein